VDLWGPNPQPSLLLLTCILGIRDEFLEAVFVLFNVLLLLSLNGCRFGVPVRKKNDFGNNTDKKPQSFVRKFGTKTNSISPDNTPSCTVKLHNSWRGTWYGSWTGTDACYLIGRFRIRFTRWHRFYADKDSDSKIQIQIQFRILP